MSRVVGRVTLLAEVRRLLSQGRSVALAGPAGIGKSALLDALEPADSGSLALRASGAPAEQSLPYAALQDLLDQVPLRPGITPPGVLAKRLIGTPVTDALRAAVGVGLLDLLAATTAERPATVLLDDAHWLDPDSACALAYARRRLDGRLRVVATVGPGAGIDLTGLHRIDVPPLERGDMIDLLAEHGLPAHTAQRLHVESGGVPGLALALCGAVTSQPVLLGRPTPIPPSLEQVVRERFSAQPREVRTTLGHASLLHRPTIRQLERAGREDAESHVRQAALAGLVSLTGDLVRFTPPALRQMVVDLATESCRGDLHRELAAVAPTIPEQLRHRALADPRPNPRLARRLAAAGAQAATTGARELATELFLLAADRATCDLAAERAEWLATAVETGAPGNHAELVHRALTDLQSGPATPAQLVRVRLALLELAGSGVAAMDEVLAAALCDAGDDDRLVAMVLLQRARVALMEAQPSVAVSHAERAVRLLRRSGQPGDLACGLTTLAVASRWTGCGDHDTHLAEALAQPAGGAPVLMHLTPAYMAARFALYDDRLHEAWSAFLSMLAQVERGAGMDQVHVLRCLVEVGARLGRCAETRRYAERAAAIAEEFDLDPHTGWFVTGLAELAAGDLARARALAERGAAAARERGDARYLQRHLLLLGQASLRSGDAQGARAALERIRAIEDAQGISDPTVNRWQPELVSALVALGDLETAGDVLTRARAALDGRSGTDGIAAQLDRVEAELLGARGEIEEAMNLLDRSGKVCAELGMRIDVGRSLLVRAHLERRRRRAAAARAALERAEALFRDLQASGWLTQVRAELARAPGHTAALCGTLTDTEARVASEVARGASNREIAERLFLSVKTVEATLTRVYRKLDVRSRTQLATRVSAAAGPGAGGSALDDKGFPASPC